MTAQSTDNVADDLSLRMTLFFLTKALMDCPPLLAVINDNEGQMSLVDSMLRLETESSLKKLWAALDWNECNGLFDHDIPLAAAERIRGDLSVVEEPSVDDIVDLVPQAIRQAISESSDYAGMLNIDSHRVSEYRLIPKNQTEDGVDECASSEAQFWSIHALTRGQGSFVVADVYYEDSARQMCNYLNQEDKLPGLSGC